MSAYARVHDGQVVEVLELSDNWIAELEANNNPKRLEFYKLSMDSVPAYNEDTQYIFPVFSVGNMVVNQSWTVGEIS
ncbi:hypothetical protein FJZ55_00775 [Candidatus Woesearchaeota archaeon]|nr:hypothetical protein [Candidatus Woesearchaeota archaeon]